ncbi:DNA repair protein RadA [Caldicellulosiruptor hydrothermalis 108]|uniref:DNA repair protein RadA n=1 Tax=Caldicellulosiruptor hydrothermalis (strain DSM 18901 / VKM B-2411 / 108) TaxID=632292 RepID=E4QDL1_CALH1|nr:DNA repair protein RadA [Caldicellulosiruptor hydrothermalis]ADQ06428.1 DNA repair protein RadA [Caldicellulosiruptor hydrothermalis 108]
MKMKSVYVCQECGFKTSKWLGRCPNCSSWDTFVLERIDQNKKETISISKENSAVLKLSNVSTKEERFLSGIEELDTVIGGGFVKGELVLLGGEPGIGKSTLLLQVANILSGRMKVLYVSGEEGANQLKVRAQRLNIDGNFDVVCETNFDLVKNIILETKPEFVIIDSIQTMYMPENQSAPGSVTQVRDVTMQLLKIAKTYKITAVIVGHVTKDGLIAGPRVLEHMVDCVLYFEGERFNTYRVIRAYKNRFGPTNQLGIFEMTDGGLVEVKNPSSIFLESSYNVEGVAIYSAIEGTRSILLEIQALTTPTSFGTPRRTVTGIDYNRCVMLCAVLEKKIGLALNSQDIYVNVAGGFKVSEPAADLAIVCAIASSYKGIPIGDTVLIGEVGLTGEIRAVSNIEKRLNEAKKLGFKRAIVPKRNMERIQTDSMLEVFGMSNIEEVLNFIF